MNEDIAYMEAVRKQLVAERAAADLTVVQASERAGMGRTTLHYIEKGEREPGVKQVIALCEAYGVGVAAFFARVENRLGK